MTRGRLALRGRVDVELREADQEGGERHFFVGWVRVHGLLRQICSVGCCLLLGLTLLQTLLQTLHVATGDGAAYRRLSALCSTQLYSKLYSRLYTVATAPPPLTAAATRPLRRSLFAV